MLIMDDYIQAIIGVFVITDPLGKSIFFLMLTRGKEINKTRAAIRVALTVGIILTSAAIVGKEFLDLMGIHLGAFGFIGGVIVAAMGLEMLGGGSPSRIQGGKDSQDGPSPEDTLMVPFSMPFIAGPGAITLVITLSAKTPGWESTIMTLIAVGVNVALLLFSFIILAGYMQKLSERIIAIATRFGGLIVATIGVQLAFNGIKSFFGINY